MQNLLNFLVFRFSSPGVFPVAFLISLLTYFDLKKRERAALSSIYPGPRDLSSHPDYLLIKEIEARPDFRGLGLSLPPDVFRAYSQAAKRINYQPHCSS